MKRGMATILAKGCQICWIDANTRLAKQCDECMSQNQLVTNETRLGGASSLPLFLPSIV